MSVVLYDKRDHVAEVTINRPEARNAVSPEVAVKLDEIWHEVERDDDVRVVILTGAGGKSFCAGADLAKLIPLSTGARQPEDEWDERVKKDPRLTNRALLRNFDPGKPIIAAVDGYCIAGGLELLQATDIRVCSEDARFGLQEPKWGLFPLSGSTVRLPAQIPYAHAMEILLTGNLVDAERALAMGIVNRVVPKANVLDAAREYATQIAGNGPVAVRAIRRSVKACRGLPEEEALKLELEIGGPVFGTEDAREGPRAFQEKRKPNFKGR